MASRHNLGILVVLCLVVTVAIVATASSAGARAEPKLVGEYVEARTCDVWTGPCFSNSEMNTTGEFAVFGWSISRGQFDGQDLGGLRLAAAIRADGTLMCDGEGKVKTVAFVDKRATKAQAKALLALGKKLAGKYFSDVREVHSAEINYDRADSRVTLEVKGKLKIKTTPLAAHCDTLCGNEEVAYASISKTDAFVCAKTLVHYYRGGGLKAKWSSPFRRSAMVGTFSL